MVCLIKIITDLKALNSYCRYNERDSVGSSSERMFPYRKIKNHCLWTRAL